MNTEAPRHTDPTKDISYSPWSHKESYTTETHTHRHTHTHTHTHTTYIYRTYYIHHTHTSHTHTSTHHTHPTHTHGPPHLHLTHHTHPFQSHRAPQAAAAMLEPFSLTHEAAWIALLESCLSCG